MLQTYKITLYGLQYVFVFPQQMDEIFGQSGVGSATEGTVVSTPLFPTKPPEPAVPPPTQQQQQQPPDRPTDRKSASQAAAFYETYEAHAERRTAVLESLVRPDPERFRRLKGRRNLEKKVFASLSQIPKFCRTWQKRKNVLHK